VFVPWENVFAYGDIDKVNNFFPRSGFLPRSCSTLHAAGRKARFHRWFVAQGGGCDWLQGFPRRASAGRRGACLAQSFLGLTDAMARTTTPWTPGYVLPNLDYGLAYRVASSQIYRA